MDNKHSHNEAREPESFSDSEAPSDSDSDTLIQSRSSKDKETLREYDEAERLLIGEKATEPKNSTHTPIWRSRGASKGTSREGRKGQRKRRRSTANDEASSLVYEMEEGYKDNSSNSSTESLPLPPAAVSRISLLRWILISSSIAALFAVLAYGAYKASNLRSVMPSASLTLSNGTHLFEATTILISLDGFRADFLQRGLTPALNAFIASGVSPQYMLPSFPSVTFPNHYTLVTGLYPESHGIVGNQFWDPEFEEEFYYTNTSISMQAKWWESAEPLWVTAEKQGMKTAVHMWPGSEAHIHNIDPTYLDKFNDHEALPNKVDRILQWIDLEKDQRPQLIAAYVPDVDRDGHLYGPNSTEIRATIAEADNMLTLLIEGLLARNLTEIVNVAVVSDHGMATMSAHRMVQLDDLIDMSLIDHLDGWPLRGLRLKNPDRDVAVMYEQLSAAAKEHGTFDVYTLDNMPKRYHFSNNLRIAPLWVVPKTGWLVIERKEFNIAQAIEAGVEFHPIGIHGFDHEHPLMRAIFVARGPAFPHPPNSRVPVFQNIEVYNIVCDSLSLAPHSNNGTLRLPLKTEGLHSDFSPDPFPPKDDPADLDHDKSDDDLHSTPVDSEEPASSTAIADPPEQAPATEDDAKTKWWQFLHNQLQKAKDWAKQIMDSIKNNKPNSGDVPVE